MKDVEQAPANRSGHRRPANDSQGAGELSQGELADVASSAEERESAAHSHRGADSLPSERGRARAAEPEEGVTTFAQLDVKASLDETYLYFVQIARPEGPIKIGITWLLGQHIARLQESNPDPLKVLAIEVYSTPVLAGARERALHALFHALRIRGDWFRPDEQVLQFASAAMTPVEFVARPRAVRQHAHTHTLTPPAALNPSFTFEMYSPEEAAGRLGISKQTLMALAHDGRVPYCQFSPSIVRFQSDDIRVLQEKLMLQMYREVDA